MIAFDTNVLIYACDKADPSRQQVALDLVSTAHDRVLLWQVACEFVAASRKLKNQDFTTVDAPLGGLSGNLSARPAECQGVGTSSGSPRGKPAGRSGTR